MLTVLDAHALLGETSAVKPGKVVALRGDEQIGLAVDRTGDLVDVDEMKSPNETNTLITGVIEKNDQSVLVLDAQQLFATAMRGRERRRRNF